MKLGIIGAMDVEVEYLIRSMDVKKVSVHAGQTYYEGNIGKTDVVVVQCGIGKVRAGMAAQVLCSCFQVTHIINTGIAGSLNNDINIGDIVVSKDAVFHDVDAVNFGYQLGEIPGIETLYYKADETLQKLAADAVKECAPEVNAFYGRVATGDVFVSDRAKKEWIRETFHADCTEMEGCAIAECAYLNQIPFVIIRAISDKADESVSETYEVFEAKAARHCAAIVHYMVENL